MTQLLLQVLNKLWNGFVHTTSQFQAVLAMQTFTRETDYVFFSLRGREYQHIHRDSLNAHLKKMGYKGLTTAHGFRHLALTAGQEVLKVDHEIIQRQMAHSFGDKIRGYYDKSQMLTERKDFMIAWCDALVEQGLIT